VASVALAPPPAVAAMQLRLLEVTAVALAVATVAVLALRAGGKSHRRQQPSGRSSPRFIRSLVRSSFSSPAGTTFIFNCLFSATQVSFEVLISSLSTRSQNAGQYFASQHINRPSAAFRLLFFGSLHYEEHGVTGSYNHPTAHSLIQH
jgi:hypothetical protein